MRIYAAIYGFMEFDPAKQMALKTGFGGTVQLPIGADRELPAGGARVGRSSRRARADAAGGARRCCWCRCFVVFYWFAARFGSSSKERKHERGAMLVTLAELVRDASAPQPRASGRAN